VYPASLFLELGRSTIIGRDASVIGLVRSSVLLAASTLSSNLLGTSSFASFALRFGSLLTVKLSSTQNSSVRVELDANTIVGEWVLLEAVAGGTDLARS
jgi:hypothetical protein